MRVCVFAAALFLATAVLGQGDCGDVECYKKERATLVALDEASLIGDGENTTALEEKAANVLVRLREQLIAKFEPPLAQRNWREAENLIRSTTLFRLLKAMPKGACLHVHGLGNMRYAISIGTYLLTCYVDLRPASSSFGSFAYSPTPVAGFTNTVAARAASGNAAAFDDMLWNLTQFWTPPLDVNETQVWAVFDGLFSRVNSLLSEPSVSVAVLKESFLSLLQDGMQHVELRVPPNSDQMLSTIVSTLASFNALHNSSLSIRFIVQQRRRTSFADVTTTMQQTLAAMQTNPLIVGYDLVDEEDAGFSLRHFAPDFVGIRNYALEKGWQPLPYYFHCAETDNVTHGGSNLFDALLLNSHRLGHALGLRDHPALMRIVNTTRTGLELCPVSNQLLRYFADIRTHPGASYVAEGLPVTLNSDDPITYGYTSAAPTPEFFMSFLSWDLSLPALKQIAVNSILFSALGAAEKQQKLIEHERLYKQWIEMVAQNSNL